MWGNFLVRILRRKIVLCLILGLSTTYCVLSFWRDSIHEGNGLDRDGESSHPRLLFLWQSDKEDENTTQHVVTTCRNSVQGKDKIVDERGYICHRIDVLGTGCCNLEKETTRRFACDTCQPSGCCEIYEFCISCCLHPDKKAVLQDVLGKASENVLFASVTDHFELCLAKCRTSSQSVRHENSYKDPAAKHCYGAIPAEEILTTS